MDKDRVNAWVQQHHELLTSFDLNADGQIDTFELSNIHATLAAYIKQVATAPWYYYHDGAVKGPIPFVRIPRRQDMFMLPAGSTLWLPYGLLELAQTASPTSPSKRHTKPTDHLFPLAAHRERPADPNTSIIGSLLLAAALLVLLYNLPATWRGLASYGWPTVDARITNVRMVGNGQRGSAHGYIPRLTLSYAVDGKSYQPFVFMHEMPDDEFFKNYPEGGTLTIVHKPGDPAVMQLRPGIVTPALIGLVFAAMLALPGFFLLQANRFAGLWLCIHRRPLLVGGSLCAIGFLLVIHAAGSGFEMECSLVSMIPIIGGISLLGSHFAPSRKSSIPKLEDMLWDATHLDEMVLFTGGSAGSRYERRRGELVEMIVVPPKVLQDYAQQICARAGLVYPATEAQNGTLTLHGGYQRMLTGANRGSEANLTLLVTVSPQENTLTIRRPRVRR